MQPMQKQRLDPVELARQAVSEILNDGLSDKYELELSEDNPGKAITITGDQSFPATALSGVVGVNGFLAQHGSQLFEGIAACLICVQPSGSHPAANPHEYWISACLFFPFPNNLCSTNGMRETSARSGASATRSRAMPVNPWGSLLTGTSKTLRTPNAGSWTRKRRGSCGGFTA